LESFIQRRLSVLSYSKSATVDSIQDARFIRNRTKAEAISPKGDLTLETRINMKGLEALTSFT